MIYPADPLGAEGREAAQKALASGLIVAIPTDTVYVLAVDPFVPGASDRLFELVERSREQDLPVLVAGLMKHAGVRVLVVDDNSPDGTGALADSLGATYDGRVCTLHRTTNRGFGRSYIDGMRQALFYSDLKDMGYNLVMLGVFAIALTGLGIVALHRDRA